MAHREQEEFIASVRDKHPKFFKRTRVLEIGSLNVNGSVRHFFKLPSKYIGVDCHAGKDVDVVCLAHEYAWLGPPFDVVISCEAFEHDPFWEKTIPHVIQFLKPGGLFVSTWASPNRQEHGTLASTGTEWGPDPTYYKGLSVLDVRSVIGELLNPLTIKDARHNLDVYCWGLKVNGKATV